MQTDFYKTLPYYKNYINKLCLLKRQYPFIELTSIGKSCQGKRIPAVFLGNMNSPAIIVGAVHANEWLTECLLVRFLEEILKSISNKSELIFALKKRGFILVPCLNPDGVELVLTKGKSAGEYSNLINRISDGNFNNFSANIRGVDLNHNFDAGHKTLIKMERALGIYSPSQSKFGGLRPHSENESRALVSLCRKFKPSRAYAYHSQGEEIFYKYGGFFVPGAEIIAKTLSDLSGYALSTQSGTASHGGFKDWFIKEFNCPGFTIEIGRGKNPLPISELSPIFARLYEMMLTTLII